MPISKENEKLYPGGSIKSREWQAIRSYIRARAGDRCEECGVRHLTYGVRFPDGSFIDLGLDKTAALSEYEHGKFIGTFSDPERLAKLFPRLILIVCTVAHMDRGLTDHSAMNLKFLCQLHHNRHDGKSRALNAARTRRLNTHGPDLVEWIEGQTT